MDQVSFSSLWASSHKIVAIYVASFVQQVADIDDIMQETAIVAHRRFADFDHNKNFTAWTNGIARNVSRNYFRQMKRQHASLDNDVIEVLAETAVAESSLLNQYAARLQACMTRLSERAQRLIQQYYGGNVDQKTVAEQEGMSASAVRTGLHRAREHLKRCIEHGDNDGA